MDFLRRGNRELIKDINRALVIDQLRKNGPMSRTEIAKQTNLGLSTVTKIVDSLMEQRLVCEVGQGDSSGGRRPIFIDLNYDYGYCIGIRVIKRGFKLAVTNLRPQILERIDLSFPDNAPFEEVRPVLLDGLRRVISARSSAGLSCFGIGVGISGLVDLEAGKLLSSKLLGWEEIEFRSLLEEQFQVPVFVDNDVNTYALAELSYGRGRYIKNFAVIALGVGLGAGLVLDGHLYRGEFGGAGEIGHTILFPEGKKCYCGQKGCLETYVGDGFILEETKRLLVETGGGSLYERREDLRIEDVFAAAHAGDPIARKVLATVGRNLGIGLINLINTLNPKAIFLTGEHLAVAEYILPSMKEVLKNTYFSQFESSIEIGLSDLGPDAWELGAVAMVLNELFRAPIYRDKKEMALV